MTRLPLVLASLVLALASCTSQPLKIDDDPVRADEVVVGPTEGSATGIMLFQFIPVTQNGRFQDAYDDALRRVGGSRLVDVTIEERWFWAYILNGYIFKVSGTAVKKK